MSVPLNLPNKITIVRALLIPVFLVLLLGEWPVWLPAPAAWQAAQPWIAAAVFALLAATDGVDGYIARSRNQVTTFGKFIDPIADKLLVTAALVALVGLDKLPGWIAIVIISREYIVSGLRMVAVAEGKVIAASNVGKVKTVFQVLAVVAFILKGSPVFLELFGVDGGYAFDIVAWGLMVVALLLTVYSMIDYIYHARDVLVGPWTPGSGGEAPAAPGGERA